MKKKTIALLLGMAMLFAAFAPGVFAEEVNPTPTPTAETPGEQKTVESTETPVETATPPETTETAEPTVAPTDTPSGDAPAADPTTQPIHGGTYRNMATGRLWSPAFRRDMFPIIMRAMAR